MRDKAIEDAIDRVCRAALKAGVAKADILAPRLAFAMWQEERDRREALENDADLGRRVRNSQSEKRRRELEKQRFEVLAFAFRLHQAGTPMRGLAGHIRRQHKLSLSERQIRRILSSFGTVYYA